MVEGLEEVIAAQTLLSEVDGAHGRLILRGHSLDTLAGTSHFEDVLALLWADLFTPDDPTASVAAPLGAARVRVFEHVVATGVPRLERPLSDLLRSCLAELGDEHDRAMALELVAVPAVCVPALIRLKRGLNPIAPDAQRTHAADLLAMLHGETPSAAQVAALDTYLVTVCDHGLNASTFTARVIASTQAGLTAAVLGAFCALTGPLHGGAPGPVLDMLDAIGEPVHARAWLEAALGRGERLMGFGHRVYRVRDPRAGALERALQVLASAGGVERERLQLAAAVEHTALELLARHRPNRPLATNVEYATALLLEALGWPREAFTGVFAASRVAGWIAHAREQARSGRLIRPRSRYVGPRPSDAA